MHCKHAAAQKLKEMGFENVWAYEGGTAEWYQMGLKAEGKYPVEGTCQASYLSAANEKPAQLKQLQWSQLFLQKNCMKK